jgi:hypothetical protein
MTVVIPPLITELCSENQKNPAAGHLITKEGSGRKDTALLINRMKGVRTGLRVFNINKYSFYRT